jgi:hypothetical protein
MSSTIRLMVGLLEVAEGEDSERATGVVDSHRAAGALLEQL